MKAKLRFHRQQPRKTRLVANLIRGKRVDQVLVELAHLNKRAASAVKKLVESAAANAKVQHGHEHKELMVKDIRVDKGITFKRFKPRARGRAAPIRKRTSHISIQLEASGEGK